MAICPSNHVFTAGPWDYFVGNANGRGLVRVEAALTSEDAGEHICSFPRGPKGEAHAALVTEAGTVLHETGLTPRQLADAYTALRDGSKVALQAWSVERTELELALVGMVNLYCKLANSGDAGFWDPEKVYEVIVARAAIAKAQEGGAS